MSAVSRRKFLQSSGGVFFAAGMSDKSLGKLFASAVPPEDSTPGVWNIYASTCRECPAGCGMYLWHRDGRVTKAEGNPVNPISRGGLCARGQSAVQGLYDPDRLKEITYRGQNGAIEHPAWAMAIEEIGNRIKHTSGKVALISGLQGDTLTELMTAFVRAFGSERLVFYEPFNYEALRNAHELVFGVAAVPHYNLELSPMVISFGADFLENWISPVGFASRLNPMRGVKDERRGRFVYVGPRRSMTAANADTFFQVPAGGEAWMALAMVCTIVRKGWSRAAVDVIYPLVNAFDPTVPEALSGQVSLPQIEEMAEMFAKEPGSVALAGPTGGAGPRAEQTAVAVALLNAVAGGVGPTVDFSQPHAIGGTARAAELRSFLESITPDDTVFVCDTNPVYSIPGASEFLRKAGCLVHMGTMPDETSELATWVLPIHSPLESWGDFSPVSGIHNLLQPTMAPLYDTMLPGDILLGFSQVAEAPLVPPGSERPAAEFKAWLLHRWQGLGARLAPAESFETFWNLALRGGGIMEGRIPPTPSIRPEAASFPMDIVFDGNEDPAAARLWAWPSVMLFDGRVSNRGWLQEAPDPTSSNVWGSWVDIHPARAAALGMVAGQVVEIQSSQGIVEAPARITDDVSQDVVAIAFGQGHASLGRNAAGRGANVFQLLGLVPGEGPFPKVTLRATERTYQVACASAGQDLNRRPILQWVSLDALEAMKPGEGDDLRLPLPEGFDPAVDIYPPREYANHRWGMVVDLARCTGCGACAVSCYAENNINVRGEAQMRDGREGAWLQIAPYRDPDAPGRLGFFPVMCQHCDAAPCEPVCPVYASTHNEEGLNAQVYNRCIGTRYCSNNCPYKVRRFNWYDVEFEEPLNLQLNPEVSVRSRGVMEKCTFCIQRIRQAEHRALREGRAVRDGEIQPACAQSCPTRAIVFGDLLDGGSEVSQLTRNDPRRYHVLETLNTKPAITYLRRIKPREA